MRRYLVGLLLALCASPLAAQEDLRVDSPVIRFTAAGAEAVRVIWNARTESTTSAILAGYVENDAQLGRRVVITGATRISGSVILSQLPGSYGANGAAVCVAHFRHPAYVNHPDRWERLDRVAERLEERDDLACSLVIHAIQLAPNSTWRVLYDGAFYATSAGCSNIADSHHLAICRDDEGEPTEPTTPDTPPTVEEVLIIPSHFDIELDAGFTIQLCAVARLSTGVYQLHPASAGIAACQVALTEWEGLGRP